MEKFLSEHPQIDAVLSANDSMALGVLQALKEANRTSIVIGINGILPAVKQIETSPPYTKTPDAEEPLAREATGDNIVVIASRS